MAFDRMDEAALEDPVTPLGAPTRGRPSLTKLIASRGFQKWAARFPLTRRLVRREGEALFDLLAGFCHSQVLMALVQMEIPQRLMSGPADLTTLAQFARTPPERMEILLRAGVSLDLLKAKRGGRYALSRRGAALVGVPGLSEMIRHHDVLYRDLADPVAFFRGQTVPELAGFWPYVFGGDVDASVAQTYSDLMAQSQVLVVEDTLRTVSFKGVSRLLDVGGGTGAFLEGVGRAYPALDVTLFDLPPVVPAARARFDGAGMTPRADIQAGSFRRDPLPQGADMISLVRVLYDHTDETVAALLSKVYAALPDGGRLLVSEPMLGDAKPARAGDAYFALYTLAMGTGKTRSPSQIAALCRAAGFADVRIPKSPRPFVTQVVVAQKSAGTV